MAGALERKLRNQIRDHNAQRLQHSWRFNPEIVLRQQAEQPEAKGLIFELRWWDDEECGTMLHKITSTFFNDDDHNPNHATPERVVFCLWTGHARLHVYSLPDTVEDS